MVWVCLVIAAVWGTLFGGAYGCRRKGWTARATALTVTGAYAGLCLLALLWFGPDRSALLAMTGMLLPLGAGLVVALRWPP